MQETKQDKKRYTCSFKAPDLQHKQAWDQFVAEVKDDGLDVCRVTIAFCQAYSQARAGLKEAVLLRVGVDKVIHIEQHNEFFYMVQKPRRQPYTLSCVKPQFQRHITSSLFEAYVENKARRLSGEFTYRDFLELKYDAFRRIVRRLRRKGIVVVNPVRSIPQLYFLAEKLREISPGQSTTE